jgi:hypothetical protein
MREFKKNGIPRRIESGKFGPSLKNEASRVVAGFSALGWTDDLGRPTEDLQKLVEAFGEPSWKATLSEIVPKAYPYVWNVDLETASNDDLKEAFIAYAGREADVLASAATFFLCLATEAGRSMSERFARRATRGVGDAWQWLKLAESGFLDQDVSTAFSIAETPAKSAKPAKPTDEEGDPIGSKAAELLGLLMKADKKTDDDTAISFQLISYLERRLKQKGK